jgi:hypothetical protein
LCGAPPYALNATTTLATNAANVYRGPVLYAAPRDFTLDHSKPYDDTSSLLPVGQAHGQDNYLLGTGDWSYVSSQAILHVLVISGSSLTDRL